MKKQCGPNHVRGEGWRESTLVNLGTQIPGECFGWPSCC